MAEATIDEIVAALERGDEFVAYAVGLLCMSVCTSLTPEEATQRLNMEHPTGITSRWAVADEEFAGGESNPCPCPDHPETHKHYLFNC